MFAQLAQHESSLRFLSSEALSAEFTLAQAKKVALVAKALAIPEYELRTRIEALQALLTALDADTMDAHNASVVGAG